MIIFIVIFEITFKGNVLINRWFLLFYLGSLSYLLISVVIAILNKAPFILAHRFNFNLYFLIILYIIARKGYITVDGYLIAIKIFTLIILFLFFGRILGINLFIKLFEIMSPAIMGDMKNGIASVYFKGTLEIVSGAVIFAKKRNIGWFLLCLLALAVAPSRFGVFVCMLFFLVINIKKLYIPVIICSILFLCITTFRIKIPVLIDFVQIFNSESGGTIVRSRHLESIIYLFSQNPLYLVFGQGPGTLFYSSGFHGLTDKVEISHFDILRRYGIIYFSALHIGLFFLIRNLWKTKQIIAQALMLSLLSHYIVSISNPVLLSLPYMMIICISISIVNNFRKDSGQSA
jgi:hypothetical protein